MDQRVVGCDWDAGVLWLWFGWWRGSRGEGRQTQKGRGSRHVKDGRSQYKWLPGNGMARKTALGQIHILYDWEVKQLKMLLPWKVLMSRGIAQEWFHSILISIDIKMAGGTAKNKVVLWLSWQPRMSESSNEEACFPFCWASNGRYRLLDPCVL